jgi:leucyl/phenylalanyl-tRNA---protein transferase
MQVLTSELLLCAYASGLFPMANDRHDPTIHWIEPRRRGVLPLDGFHVPRSLRKLIRQKRFQIRTDCDFRQVITACAASRPERPRTWLNDELIELYCELHELGYTHSVESWLDGRLVGGLYGVSLGAAFFGESMFSHERDASKVALVSLVERLRAGNYRLLDTQFVTDHLRQFGATEMSRAAYRARLREALEAPAVFYSDEGGVLSVAPWSSWGGAIDASQSTTQTS